MALCRSALTAERAAAELVEGRFEAMYDLFEAISSPRPVLKWQPDDADLESEHLRFLHDYWRRRARADGLPLSSGIDALDLKPVLGYVMLLEPTETDDDFLYRVYGSIIAEKGGLELTGKRVSEVPSSMVAAYFLATYRAVVVRRCSLLARHTTHHTIQITQWDRLILPFANPSGRIDRLLVGNIPGARTL